MKNPSHALDEIQRFFLFPPPPAVRPTKKKNITKFRGIAGGGLHYRALFFSLGFFFFFLTIIDNFHCISLPGDRFIHSVPRRARGST